MLKINEAVETREFVIADSKFSIYEAYDRLINLGDESIIEKYWKVNEGDICFDIGFGSGTWTLYALSKGAHVFAFDPKPYCIEILLNTVLLNRFSKCAILPFGLFDCNGVIPFSDSSFKTGTMDTTRPVRTLDEFVDSYGIRKIDYINMDVEWSDLEVIRGGKETINKLKPTVLIEVHDKSLLKDLKNEFNDYSFVEDREYLIATSGTKNV